MKYSYPLHNPQNSSRKNDIDANHITYAILYGAENF
jgi:hypothetical protein